MTTYFKHPLTAGRIVDGVAFVVTADDNQLHTLNETGTEVWNLAAKGVTAEQAGQVLFEKFDVSLEVATKDAEELLDSLAKRGILQATDQE